MTTKHTLEEVLKEAANSTVGRALAVGAYAVHNMIAHPLLVLCPPVGKWGHRVTLQWLNCLDPQVSLVELGDYPQCQCPYCDGTGLMRQEKSIG